MTVLEFIFFPSYEATTNHLSNFYKLSDQFDISLITKNMGIQHIFDFSLGVLNIFV